MPIELLVQPKDGEALRVRHDESRITIGRDPASTLRFPMSDELEVSTRHAEILERDGIYVIIDRNSTNGTWLNGARVREPMALNPGDVVNLGRAGPELRVLSVGGEMWHPTVESKLKLPPLHLQPGWRPRHRTKEWLVGEVDRRTRSLKVLVVAVAVGASALGLVIWLSVRALAVDDGQLWREVTMPAIRKANDDAVVLVETTIPVPECARGCEGTGVSLSDDGLIVTNRHVVEQRRTRATRIRVKFANTAVWLGAELVRVGREREGDLALLRVTQPGRYPSVVGVSPTGPDLPVGSSVMEIGFPLGTRLRMEGKGNAAIARTTLTSGAIAKVLPDVVQIDAFADHGSSGSPVFDRHGHMIGLVSSGARGETDRIVYMVPSKQIVDLRTAFSAP